jgi:mono/diheme cytochrome c family protein
MLSGGWSFLTAQGPPTAEVTEEMVAAGAKLFVGEAGCKMCHGADAKGVKNMTGDLTDTEWKFAKGGDPRSTGQGNQGGCFVSAVRRTRYAGSR